MEAVGNRVQFALESTKALAGGSIRARWERGLAALKRRGQAAMIAFGDSMAADTRREELIAKLPQVLPSSSESRDRAAFLFARERNETIALNDGVNHLRMEESGRWVRLTREEVGRSAGAPVWELKVDGDRIECRSNRRPELSVAESNDILELETSFLVKIVPMHLRRRPL